MLRVSSRINEAWFCMNASSLFCEHHHTNPVSYHDLCLLLKKYQLWQWGWSDVTAQLIYIYEHHMYARLTRLLINRIYNWQILVGFYFLERASFNISWLHVFCSFHNKNSSSVQPNCSMVHLIPLSRQQSWLELMPFCPNLCVQVPFPGKGQRQKQMVHSS